MDSDESAVQVVVAERSPQGQGNTQGASAPTTPHPHGPTHAVAARSNIICLCGSRQEAEQTAAHAHPIATTRRKPASRRMRSSFSGRLNAISAVTLAIQHSHASRRAG